MSAWTWQQARDVTGVGLSEIRRGMEEMPTNDPLLAACYAAADGLAVNIKSDRHAWNVERAKATAADLRQKFEAK
jgi:hypothetical protein